MEFHLLIYCDISSLFIAKLEKGLDEHTHTHTHTDTHTHIYIFIYNIYIYYIE